MNVNRRVVLKILGLSPVTAPVLGQHLSKMAASGAGLLLGDTNQAAPPEATIDEEKPQVFRSVSSWWDAFGKSAAFEETRSVDQFDADILSLHWPLQAKVAAQRRRNFEREKDLRLRDMKRRLSLRGFIKWWP